jgi:GNAT superfamily N-acetyltransferase
LTSDVSRAERALHHRTGLACEAASDAGVPGRFRTWDQAGLRAVLATDPALGFLSTVSGVTRETLPAVTGFVDAPGWDGVEPTVVVPAEFGERPMAGFARTGDRLLAVKRLEPRPAAEASPDVVDEDTFLRVLLAGFEAHGVLAAFMAAEHRLPVMRRFLVVEREGPIAAAGMTIHGDVAVLGAASTLRAHRGRGAQPRLLQRRLQMAAEAGCTLAVATARPGSTSAANLGRAGFRLHRRSAWTKL